MYRFREYNFWIILAMLSSPYSHSSLRDRVRHEVSVAHWCRELNLTCNNMKNALFLWEAYLIVSKQNMLTFVCFLTWSDLNLKLVYESATASLGHFSFSFHEHDTSLLPFSRVTTPTFSLSFSRMFLFLSFSTPGFRRHRCMDNPAVPAEETCPL